MPIWTDELELGIILVEAATVATADLAVDFPTSETSEIFSEIFSEVLLAAARLVRTETRLRAARTSEQESP